MPARPDDAPRAPPGPGSGWRTGLVPPGAAGRPAAPPARGARTGDAGAGQAGLTLLEMLVALAVVAAVLGLLLNRGPQHSAALDLGTGTRRVASALRLARGRAILTDRVVPFALDAAGTGFRLGAEGVEALPPGVRARVLPPGAGGVIRFAPDGSASGGQVLLAAGGRVAGVAVDWLTGRVRVGDGS